MSNFAKAVAVGTLAASVGGTNAIDANIPAGVAIAGGDNVLNENGYFPSCPMTQYLPYYHNSEWCDLHPRQQHDEFHDRAHIYQSLRDGANGATLIPNQRTIVCPTQVQDLTNPTAEKGFDTTWVVENTASTPVIVSWVIDGVEYSPFNPKMLAHEDPDCLLKPNEWKAVVAYESYVYHVREVNLETGELGQILLQHRAGLIPIGNPNKYECDASKPDVEPIDPNTGIRVQEFQRTPTPPVRRCNTMDIGFRNQVGCPLHVYFAGNLEGADVPDTGFMCGEKFKFHLGTKPATQDFMHDWESSTKFEGSFISHTFVARLASNPNIVIDSYTLEPTKIIDCPNLKQQQVSVPDSEKVAVQEQVANTEGTCDATTNQQQVREPDQQQLPNLAGIASTSGTN